MFTIRSDQNQIVQCPARPLVMERKWKPNIEIAPNCPRCASSNTKFCYYNNYSLSQPRYFCKGCRRYWTKGGSLRNVPVGGGCRKSRSRSSRSSSSERIGTNFVRNQPSPGRVSNDPSIGSPRKGDGAADIDLATVFAKFLNQNSGSDDSSGGANSSLELPLNSLEFESQLEDAMVESQMTSELIIDEAADGLLADFPLISNADNSVQVFSNQDSNSFGLQGLISNELTQGGLWSDGTNLRNNIIWQPMVQLQEFEDFSSDDQLKVSTSLVSDNWSLFDLPGCEIFSRP